MLYFIFMFSTKFRLWLFLVPIILWLLFFLLGIFTHYDLNISDYNSIKSDLLIYNSSSDAFWSILKNNVLIVIVNIIGFSSFGLLPLLSVIINGYSLGFLVSNTLSEGIKCHEIILHILPHGILELIGLWISSMAGIYSTFMFMKFLKGTIIAKVDFIFFLKLAFFSIVLTILSAFIESFYTLHEYLCK